MKMADQSGNKPWWTKMVVFWHENQVALTFHSPLDFGQNPASIIESLHLQDLNAFLNMRGFNITSFTPQDVPNPPAPIEEPGGQGDEDEPGEETPGQEIREGLQDIVEGAEDVVKGLGEGIRTAIDKVFAPLAEENGQSHQQANGNNGGGEGEPDSLNSPTGKYLFASPSGHGTSVVAFFHADPTPAYSMAGMDMNTPASMGMTSTYGSGAMPGMSDYSGKSDTTRGIVNLINDNLNTLRLQGGIPITAASPNWFGASTPLGCTTHGCPIRPPLPVPVEDLCDPATDCWRITLDDLATSTSPLRDLQGDGVTVFVLDSFPGFDTIQNAAGKAGNNNGLLQEMAARLVDMPIMPGQPLPVPLPSSTPQILLYNQTLPARLDDIIDDDIPGTGKDVYGRLFGFEMPDHGLFVAGIVHDLVPNANIECIRILNDYGVGDVNTLCDALNFIYARMLPGGDLYQQPVVINLSLVATPSDEDLYQPEFGFNIPEVNALRNQMHITLKGLISLGAVIAASGGNDSDTTAYPPYRWGPRYPAAFNEVIAVGAVDNQGQATTYSDFPVNPAFSSFNGIATYGGGLPQAAPPFPTPGVVPQVSVTDALRGVFSNTQYPQVDADPPSAPYAPPNDNAWAYWSGTSFATPIISAVAARVLQYMGSQNLLLSPALWTDQVQWALLTQEGQTTILTGDSSTPLQSSDFGFGVSLLRASQTCQPMPGASSEIEQAQMAMVNSPEKQ